MWWLDGSLTRMVGEGSVVWSVWLLGCSVARAAPFRPFNLSFLQSGGFGVCSGGFFGVNSFSLSTSPVLISFFGLDNSLCRRNRVVVLSSTKFFLGAEKSIAV